MARWTLWQRDLHVRLELAAVQFLSEMLAQRLLVDAKLLGDVGLGETKSRSILNERALGVGRLIFGWHLPFHVAQLSFGPRTACAGLVATTWPVTSLGDVFAFWPSENDKKLFVAKSTDGGASFTALGATPVKIADTFSSFLYHIPADEPSRGTRVISLQ
jgi:hypothetical protein